MPWTVTADPARFDEALEWFAARTVMTGEAARALDDRLKQEAFWVGGGLQLEQIQHVFDKIDKAIESGESFDEWRKRVKADLTDQAHAETVFRNATQRSYNAGRYEQMTEEEVLAARPYGMVDAILDDATTEYCEKVNGTVLPLDDPWWDDHCFPAHHRCRTSVRNLRRREAERRGITEHPPEDKPAPGFGQSPRAQGDIWKPDPKRHDTELVQTLRDKAKAAGGKAERPPGEKKSYQAKHWEKRYRERYGDAAPAVASGRAALERGLDLPIEDVRKRLDAMGDAPGVREMLTSLDGLDGAATLRASAGQIDPVRRGAAAFAGHLQAMPTRATPLNVPQIAGDPEGRRVTAFFSAVTAPKVVHPVNASFTKSTNRSNASMDGKRIEWRNAQSLAHEWGHTLEQLNPSLHKRAVDFLRARTQREQSKSLALLTGIAKYAERNERTRPDRFVDVYIGKVYESGGRVLATELTSMSMEMLYAGRTVTGTTLQDLLRKDPEMFYFLLGQLRD